MRKSKAKFLLRRGPFYCQFCFQFVRGEQAPEDPLAISGVDICKDCKKKEPKRGPR